MYSPQTAPLLSSTSYLLVLQPSIHRDSPTLSENANRFRELTKKIFDTKMMRFYFLLCLLLVATHAKVYFQENFNDKDWDKRWIVPSDWKPKVRRCAAWLDHQHRRILWQWRPRFGHLSLHFSWLTCFIAY